MTSTEGLGIPYRAALLLGVETVLQCLQPCVGEFPPANYGSGPPVGDLQDLDRS